MIDLPPAVAIAKPEKRTVFQPAQAFVNDFDPRFRRLTENVRRLSVVRARRIQIQKSLLAILRLKPNLLAIGKPSHPHNQQVFRWILVSIDPMNVAAGGIDNAEFHDWIGIAGLWVKRHFQILIKRYVIDHGKLGHRMFVEPKKSDPR